MRSSELADQHTRDLRAKSGRPPQALPSAFYAITGALPKDVRPRDFDTARLVVKKLFKARANCAGLTRNEHTRLGKLITKWIDRAEGKEIRFNVMGTKAGRPNFLQAYRMRSLGWVPNYTHRPKQAMIKTCPCGFKFETKRSNKKYCNDRCRLHYWWVTKGKQHIGG